MVTYDKKTVLQFFKSKRHIDIADFIAVRRESHKDYYVYKNRYHNFSNLVISHDIFKKIIDSYKTPIVLSDIYIDLGGEKIND